MYEFVDYTGENKAGDISQYSRAVKRGGLAMFQKALFDAEEHRRFRIVERGNHLREISSLIQTFGNRPCPRERTQKERDRAS